MSAEARGLDQDLMRLPQPPRALRTLTLALMALTAALAGWLAFRLADEALYALDAGPALELGPLAEADLAAAEGMYVRAQVSLGATAASFDRPLDGDVYRVAPAGAGRWVIYRVPAAMGGPRFVPPSLVAGRLVAIDDLGPRFSGLADSLGAGGFVVVDGEDPRSAGWLIGLELLLLTFVAWNVASIVKIVRRAR